MPDSGVPLWLVDCPALYDRLGGPYAGEDGLDWHDNAWRFGVFAQAALAVCTGAADLSWEPDVVHCHDWQTGLVPALLSDIPRRPASVFTIHNLAYQGLFSRVQFDQLKLPEHLWSLHALEFYGSFSFLKGGLVFSDWITTVSPTYAREIRTAAFGCGLDGLLRHRAERLVGILNGVDYRVWDPRHDPLIEHAFGPDQLEGKAANKAALQARFGLPQDPDVPVAGFVGRLVEQKGVDLILDALPAFWERPFQLVVLGSGDRALEARLQDAARAHPMALGVQIGYDEPLAHLIEAGADLFLMPSRFEPCGLNQMYSLRYGTVPVVQRVGGLADTVVHADRKALATGTATGFTFAEPSAERLATAIEAALNCYAQPEVWRRLMRAGMAQDFSWEHSADQYLELYARVLAERGNR